MRDFSQLKQKVEVVLEEEVSIDRVFPNKWNFNEQQPHVFKAVVASIKRFGNRLYPVVVRDIGRNRLEIIDGEHRWRACKALGMTVVFVKNLGTVDDATAEEMMLLLNEDRGESDMLKLSKLVEEFKDEFGEDDVKERYPFTDAEMRDFDLFNKVDWEQFPKDWQAARKPRVLASVQRCPHSYETIVVEMCEHCGLARETSDNPVEPEEEPVDTPSDS